MQSSQSATATRATGVVTPTANAALQAVCAILLGMFIVGMAGFSHLDIVHNASHDTRHSNAFPCH